MQMVIADLHAQSFLSSQNVGALAKAFVEEFVKTSALQQVMASAIDGRLSNVATHQDVAELQQDLQGASLSLLAVML